MIRAFRPMGIRGRLVLLIVLVLIPILSIQGIFFYQGLQTFKNEELQANLELARAVGRAFDSFVQDILRQELAIGIVATSSPSLSRSDFNRLLAEILREHPVRNFTWCGPDGRVLASTLHDVGSSFSDRRYYQDIVNGREWVISPLLQCKLTGEHIFTICRGIRDGQGRLLGIVIAGVTPHSLSKVLSLERRRDSDISLVDNEGMLAFRSPLIDYTWEQRNWLKAYPVLADALKGKEIAATLTSKADGTERLVGLAPVAPIGWVAAATRVDHIAFAALPSVFFLHALFTLLAMIAAFIAALSFSRPISHAIIRLRNHALALGRGEGKENLQVSGAFRELDDLARAFQQMAEEVRSRERELKESQNLVSSVLEGTTDPVYVKDKESRILLANPALAKVAGKPLAEIVGKTAGEYYGDPAVGRKIHEDDLRVISSGANQLTEETVPTPAGYRTFLSSKVPLRNASGEIVGIIGISRDITERKQMEEAFRESEAMYRSLFENMLDGFSFCKMLFDDRGQPADFVYLAVNNAFGTLTGLKDVVGKRATEIIPGVKELHPELFEIYGRVALTGNPEKFEIDFRPLKIWLSVSAYSPRKEYFAAVFESITERKRMDEELRKSRGELEMRVQERTAKLEESEARLRALATDLINAQETERKRIAHELHDSLAAQLAAIKYRLERKRAGGESPENPVTLDEIIEDVQNANTETRRIMANLRPSVLDDLGILPALSWFSRETEKAYPGTAVECAAAVDEKEIPEALKIVLFRVMQESVTNAIRHGKSKRVRVRLDWNDPWLRLRVEDDGRGFDSVKLDGKSENAGIGLDSMQQRVDSTGGIFSISSSPGQGTIVKAEWRLR